MARTGSADRIAGWMPAAWILVAGVAFSTASAGETRYQAAEAQMGTTFQIVVYAADQHTANDAMAAAFREVGRLNAIMSDYQASSELSRLSRQSPTAGPVVVSKELWEVLDRAQSFSRLSDGAFDVTVGNLSKLWRRARRRSLLPSAQKLAEARKSVGYRALRLRKEPRSVELLRPHMRLDLGGIAKGYAADAALEVLASKGIRRAIVNAGGDMAVGDPPPGRTGWPVAVAPLGKDGPPSRFLLLQQCGIATSGDAWQYVEIDGRRYSHILDPRTGLGLSQRSGVTVVAPDGMTADALASTVSVLGPVAGLKLVEQIPGCAALVVRPGNDNVGTDRVRTTASSRFAKIPTTSAP